MRVLFVSSGNNKFGINPFIKDQGDSLLRAGIKVDYYPVIGTGIIGYIKASKKLRKYLKDHEVDIIHAHYTLSGWVSVLAFTGKPIVLSLMGSDVYGAYVGKNKITFISRLLTILTILIQPFVSIIICKSKNISNYVYLKNKSVVIPNGIQLNKFFRSDTDYRKELDLKQDNMYVLFLGFKDDPRKNYQLAASAFKLLTRNNVILLAPYPVSHDKVVKYLNSVDCLVVPSFMEGSPNVVKEAMACNCPVVSTEVGDVRWLFGDEPGHYITSYEPKEVAEKIKLALDFSEKYGKTNGRNRIIELGLDSKTIATKIIDVYKTVLKEK